MSLIQRVPYFSPSPRSLCIRFRVLLLSSVIILLLALRKLSDPFRCSAGGGLPTPRGASLDSILVVQFWSFRGLLRFGWLVVGWLDERGIMGIQELFPRMRM